MDLPDVNATVERIESVVAEHPESAELVQLLMQLYGAGLARILEIAAASGASDLIGQLAADKLIGSLLLLHDLHPEDAETRLRRALRHVERRLESHRLVLVGLTAGVANIRVEHNGGGHPPPSLAGWIESAAFEAAPDIEGVQIEGAPASGALVQIAPAGSV